VDEILHPAISVGTGIQNLGCPANDYVTLTG